MPKTVYEVEFIADDLPDGRDWVMVRQSSEGSAPPRKHLFIKQDRVCPEVIRDVWMALHQVNGTH